MPFLPRNSRQIALALLRVGVVGLGLSLGGHAQATEASQPDEAHAEDEDLPPLPPDETVSSETFGVHAPGVAAGAFAGFSNASMSGSSAGTRGTAQHYASLDKGTCEAELVRRHIPFTRVGEARGVIAPVRLTGALSGVTFRSMLSPAQRKTSPYEIYDCRLVLALDDFARVLARHDIVDVVHYSVYRPPPTHAVLTGPGRRHTGGLAIDAAIFRTRDGKTMSVEKDFHGRVGGKTCTAGVAHAAASTSAPTPANTLRQIICEAADAQLFNVLLTPHFNWAHRNHFHLEVTAGVKWTLVR